ncbi:MAG: FAD-dependent oxidoreductase [Pseudohongiellaceae bacterium]
MTLRYSTDIVVFGGGVAGLWLLNKLHQQGYNAVLLETDALGSGQSLASQGIIHGGLKYSLGGVLSGAAQAIAPMPGRWRQSLRGELAPDLSAVGVLSEEYYMWSDAGIRSRLKAFFGSKGLRGRVEAVAPADYPAFFREATVAGQLYRLPDFVVDTCSLLAALAAPVRHALFRIDVGSLRFQRAADGTLETVDVACGDETVRLSARRFIFSAGRGNRQLITAAGLTQPQTQERPLHMVYLTRSKLPDLFVHCIGDNVSLSPRLTVTAHPGPDGRCVWYLGGELAETGVDSTGEQQIRRARELLGELFPWADLGDAEWKTLRIDRAEPRMNNQFRPDDAVIICEDNAIVAWPIKLTLAPVLADKVMAELSRAGITPGEQTEADTLRSALPEPSLATPRWEVA